MKNKSFRYLWIGQTFANIGDIFYVVGLISLIYTLTGSAFYMGLLPFTTTMFRFISSLLAPVIIDRFHLKKILVQSQLWKTILLILLISYLAISALPSIFIVLLFIAFISLLDGVAQPVSGSILPLLVSKEDLMKANGFLSVTTQTIFVAGWPLGSILLTITTSSFIILLTMVLYMLSTICMLLLSVPSLQEKVESSPQSKWDSIKSGWILIWNTRPIRLMVILDFLLSIASGVWVAAILFVYVEENLHSGQQWWGYINTAYFIGMIVAGLLVIRYAQVIEKHLSTTILTSLVFSGVFTFLFGITSLPVLALGFAFLQGFPDQVKEIASTKIIQDHISEKSLAKVYAGMSVVINLTFAFSVLLLGSITELFSAKITFIFASCLIFIAVSFAFFKRDEMKDSK